MKQHILKVLILVFASGLSRAQPSEIDVILLAGQSNATGQGYVRNLPPDFNTDTTVLIYFSRWLRGKGDPETWLPLVQASESPDRFGAELALGTELQSLFSGRRFAIIKHALSGSNLYAQWNPGSSPADTVNFGDEFKKFVATVESGMQKLRDSGHIPVIRAMAWQQGEADARDIAGMDISRAYGNNLHHFIGRVREQFDAPAMLFVYGLVIPVPLERFTGREEVRQAQHDIDQQSGSPLSVNGAVLVATDDLPLRCDEPDTPYPDDKVHYNSAGMIELGKRYARAVYQYLIKQDVHENK